jgi:hypothetical protein
MSKKIKCECGECKMIAGKDEDGMAWIEIELLPKSDNKNRLWWSWQMLRGKINSKPGIILNKKSVKKLIKAIV